MHEFINIISQAIVALLIYGSLAVTYGLLGAYKNISLFNRQFDWKTYANGVAKYLALGLGVIAIIAGSYGLINLAPSWGVQLGNAQQISTKVIFGILAAGIAGMLLKNIQKLVQIFSVDPTLLEKLQKQALTSPDPHAPIILDVGDLPGSVLVDDASVLATIDSRLGSTFSESDLKRVVQSYLESVGGRGAVVPTGSWQDFRNAVINNSYDVDNEFGAQCWDGAALFWLNTVGRTFSTGGTGAARGGWEAARAVNAGSDFDLITDINAIQPGDWCVFGRTQWGHVGMAESGNLGNYVRLLGQNQTGDGNGAPFSEINMSLNNFLGAFRWKRWHESPAPSPAPSPTPPEVSQPNPAVQIGSTVQPTKPVDYYGTSLAPKVMARLYPVTELSGDRAVLGNGLNTAFHTGDLRVISNPEASLPDSTPSSDTGFSVGDTVVPTKAVDYDSGQKLQIFDPTYTISELNGDRAVLVARGQVWSAISTANIRHA